MSTNARIIIQRPGCQEWASIYCHYDGYIEHLGNMLLNHYYTHDKVVALVSMGDAVFISEVIGLSEFFHRDKKEDLHIISSEKLDDHLGYEYCYLFSDGSWQVHREARGNGWRPLSDFVK